MARNYRQEYDRYQGRPEHKKRRAGRNKARRMAEASGAAKPGDGNDVHHVDGNPRNNSPSNRQIVAEGTNRSLRRNKNAGKA